jgi:hypothetical protein
VFLFGHIGIGRKLASPWWRLPGWAILVGTVLPDAIDKPLYYAFVAVRGREQTVAGLISGTRTFGHTGLFLLAVALLGAVRRSPWLLALALGIATHLLIDNVGDLLGMTTQDGILRPLLWPLNGWNFPISQFNTIADHLAALKNPWILGGEVVGLALLAWDYRKSKQSRVISGEAQ